MPQAIAGLLGCRVRVMASPGLLVEINHMPDAGRSLNRHDRASEAAPIIQICAPRGRGRQASLGAPNGGDARVAHDQGRSLTAIDVSHSGDSERRLRMPSSRPGLASGGAQIIRSGALPREAAEACGPEMAMAF